ncbi:MAG: SPFH domain-containing protein [Planctomycetota bacterium]
MAITTPPPGDSGATYPILQFRPSRLVRLLGLLLLIPILGLLIFCYHWFIQRVEVGAGEVLVLVRKVGEDLPSISTGGKKLSEAVRGQVVLHPELLKELNEPVDSIRYKGIMYEVLPEGRYFYDPFFWERIKRKAIVISQDEIGIRIRRYGKPLSDGKIVATTPKERGPLAEVLMPGRYNINPFAYEVKRFVPVVIPPGFVGVQRLYHGSKSANPNDWVVQTGERGVQPEVLPAGTYYKNPFVERIELIDVRSHTLDLSGEGAIRFPSSDSFEIVIEATVEYAISQDKAPYVMVAIGEHADIEEKLILPYARGLSRIEGSKLLAREFISGETRTAFQNAFFEGLRAQCTAQGIEVRATPIRRIEPPPAIANPISDRQVADQQIKQYENEMKVAESQARLVEQEELSKQNQDIGTANREVVTVIIQAEQEKAVALTEAAKRLEVAKLDLEAARENAAALLSRGQASAEVTRLQYEAEAKPLADAIKAFGDGRTYAQYFFYQKLGPALKSVLASTEGPFADLFRALSESPAPAPAQGEQP